MNWVLQSGARNVQTRVGIKGGTKKEDSADLNLVKISSLCKTMKLQVSGKREVLKRCCKKNKNISQSTFIAGTGVVQ